MLLDDKDEVFDGATFRIYRDHFGARIETGDPVKVCGALGVPIGEPGIEIPRTSGAKEADSENL